MSRPRTSPEVAAEQARENFRREVKVQRVYLNMTQRELAEETGVVPSAMSKLLANPDQISVGRLRKMVQSLQINPTIILMLVGYTPKEIKRFKDSNLKPAANE